MVSFLPLDITDVESVDMILQNIDMAIQYGEDNEVQEGRERENEEESHFSGGDD
jgi:hypothetical protein